MHVEIEMYSSMQLKKWYMQVRREASALFDYEIEEKMKETDALIKEAIRKHDEAGELLLRIQMQALVDELLEKRRLIYFSGD